MILTNPATMGLFFMGAILLMEKSQRVLNSLAVAPIKVQEYIVSKAVSLSIISVIVSVIIALFFGIFQIPGIIIGTLLGSILVTMIGICIGCRAKTLNMFIILTVSVEFVTMGPALCYQFGINSTWRLLHPMCAMIELFSLSRFTVPSILSLVCWNLIFLLLTERSAKKMIRTVGGVKL